LRKILEKTFVADLEHHASIGSTNDRAIECAKSDVAKLPLLILADRQTAGRGRGPNRWWTGQGSLAFSLLIGPEHCTHHAPRDAVQHSDRDAGVGGPPRWPLISLAAGLAVVETLIPLVPGHEIGIHWPNDCMIDGGKVAGILIEALPGGKHVIGIGINVNNRAADAPEEVRPRVATLCDVTGREHDAVELLIAVLCQIERQLGELARSPQGIAARTDEICLQRGKRLQVVQGEKRFEGRCLGIAADGALLLEIDGQPHLIYSGTVSQESTCS
jgi:BirA family transcriptional regulator, biotin operon repressor / biotin---[acetyl-CoA-carboxylase] ligase